MARLTFSVLFAAACLAACGPEHTETIPETEIVPKLLDDTGAPIALDKSVKPKAVLSRRGAQRPPLRLSGTDAGADGPLYAAALGGYFLLRAQRLDGSFGALYAPNAAFWRSEDAIFRQIGGAYTLALLYDETGREEFRLGADWAIEHVSDSLVDLGPYGLRLKDLGSTAIMVFALTQMKRTLPEDFRWDDTLKGLTTHLLSRIDEAGDVLEGIELVKGQVIQAVGHLHLTSGDARFLDLLERMGRFACDHFESHYDPRWRKYFVYYANEPLLHLYRQRPADWIPACVAAMTDPFLDDQWMPGDTRHESWIGGFGKRNGWRPLWNAALWLEAIADAHALARESGDEARAEVLRPHMIEAARFVMRMQWRRGETDDFPEPDVPIGGYPFQMTGDTHGKLGWPLTRTDLAWHGTAALLKVTRELNR